MALSRATIANAVSSAFKVLGDIPQAATLKRGTSAYNPSTGTNVITYVEHAIAKAVGTKWEDFAVDKVNILATDLKLIFQQSEISVMPNEATDNVVFQSKTWNIVRVSQDPAGATYTLQLRAP